MPTHDCRNGDVCVTVDLKQSRVSVNGRDVKLTPMEFQVLALILSKKGKVLTDEEFRGAAYPDANNQPGTNVLKVYVRYIRQKLEAADPATEGMIHNVFNGGYRIPGSWVVTKY